MLRIKAIFFLLLFSVSLVGNALELHYCKGELTDIALIGSADCVCPGEKPEQVIDSCSMDKGCGHHKPSKKQKPSKSNVGEKDCCQTEIVQLLDSSNMLSTPKTTMKVAVAVVLYNPQLFIKPVRKKYQAFHYNEPDFWADIPILIQSFLI